ncbi:YhaN family protein [Alkalilacustris brevis]|uniref:YhaN family protein n=1 Tax=Alkalilacustris brevis TaxID=2026338 RepID=UPI000E0D5423|nr:YhaN family protein [Alkalilacustris brevis]
MRLRSLSLDRFGHFTDRQFDFGKAGDTPDFHIIYGPNEAGKTTIMEAALRLFYGFAHREGYAFKHQRANLQVSGQLEIDGQLRQFTRLPKRSGSLVDAAGTALPETALSAHLAGLSEEDYRQLLCLDDETIERGGEEIVQARGDIGRLLFSAAAGVADLSTVLEGVRDDADAIWRKRASKTRVAELKRELTQVEKDIRERDVSASAWRGLKKALADTRTTEGAARAARDALHERAAQIAAMRRALPMLAGIDDLAGRIAPFAAYPERLDFDPESLVRLLAEETQAKADIQRLTGEIEELTATRDGLDRAPGLVALAGHLDALDDLRSRDVTAGLDLDRRREQVREAEAAMARAARDLGVAANADLQNLVLSPAEIARLDAAREALRNARAAVKAEAHEVGELTERRDRAKAAFDSTASRTPAGHGVGDILARHDVDRLAPAQALARQAIDAAETAVRHALEALTVGAMRFRALPDCPTSLIKAQAWAGSHADFTVKINKAEDALAQHIVDVAARRAQADQVMSGGRLVPDAEAEALKAERDRLWQAHRATLSEETLRPFETAMQALDATMQARVAHARDLGQLRQIEQARAEAQARADQAQTRLTTLRDQQAALEDAVNAAAAAVGLPVPQSPAEWLDWVQRHGAAAEASRKLAQTRDTHHPETERARRLLAALEPHLNLEAPDFDGALAAARALAEAERETVAATTRARDALAALEVDLTRRVEKHETAQQEAERAEAAWRSLVSDVLGDAVAPSTLLGSLDPLRTLREHDEKRADAAQRVGTMETDQAQFAENVAGLAAAQYLPLADTTAATFAMLRKRSDAAKAAETQAEELTAAIEKARDALTEKQRRLDEIGREIEAMGQFFPDEVPVDTLDALRRAATQAQQVIADRKEQAGLQRAILSELSAGNMTLAREMLEGATVAELEAEAEAVKADLARAEDQLTEATEARVTASQALSRVTGDADIAALTERKATLGLELEEAALEHLELSIGHRLAEEAIRRYRDTHRSGMLAATERCFAALTRGAYARLTTQPDGADETLLAVDGDGTAKRVAEMSKGTRFQLYLALRAAAHEQLVAQGTRLPFFCDDIFETFDEDRTSAACRIMEQIGRSGQAIYLTHHRHVVDIAQQVCDTAPVIHEI